MKNKFDDWWHHFIVIHLSQIIIDVLAVTLKFSTFQFQISTHNFREIAPLEVKILVAIMIVTAVSAIIVCRIDPIDTKPKTVINWEFSVVESRRL